MGEGEGEGEGRTVTVTQSLSLSPSPHLVHVLTSAISHAPTKVVLSMDLSHLHSLFTVTAATLTQHYHGISASASMGSSSEHLMIRSEGQLARLRGCEAPEFADELLLVSVALA